MIRIKGKNGKEQKHVTGWAIPHLILTFPNIFFTKQTRTNMEKTANISQIWLSNNQPPISFFIKETRKKTLKLK